MRGEEWEFEGNNDVILLKNPTFIIDGQQRRGTILEYLKNNPKATIRQGVAVHFSTTMEWERQRFHSLNLHQTRVSAPILLRNMRSTNPCIATFYGLTVTDKDFPLQNRVGWGQMRTAKDLISATLYIKLGLILHGHFGGGIVVSNVSTMESACIRLEEIIGLSTIRKNTVTFWQSIDTIWGVRDLQRRPGALWLKSGFLIAYANVLSDHRDFWDGKTLIISSNIIQRLRAFYINDPEIRLLATAGGQAHRSLQFHIINFINKYKQNRLDQRPDTVILHRQQAAGLARKGKKKRNPK